MTTKINNKPQTLDDCTHENTTEFNFVNQIKQAKIVDVYDGDTCKAVFAFNGEFVKFNIRMYGYNCHEMKQHKTDPNAEQNKQLAIAARDYLRTLVLNKIIFLQCLELDKYGRIIGKIYTHHTMTPDTCVNDMMLANGHGYIYYGTGDKFNQPSGDDS